jgi:glycine oxidase
MIHPVHDCVILGGGAIGLALAWHSARAGMRVQLIERGEPGRQTSWAAAGMIPPAPTRTTDAYQALASLSYQLHAEWNGTLTLLTGIDVEYEKCGGVQLARSAGEAAALVAAARQWQEDGIRTHRLSPDELARLEPALQAAVKSNSIRAAYHLPDEAQLRTPRYLKALLAACRLSGVEIATQVRVDGWQRHAGRVVAVETSAGCFHGALFCVAAGVWSSELLRPLGHPVDIRPWRGQIVLYAPGEVGLQHIVCEGPNYLVPRRDGHILVGSTVEDVGFDDSTTPAAVDELTHFAATLVPRLAHTPVARGWAGLRPGTADGLPYIGQLPEWPNVYVAAGHFRCGISMAPGTAVVMHQLMTGEKPVVHLDRFRLAR